jgi:hypothetical protein
MPIHAVALVRGPKLPDGLSGDVLEDAALVKTAIRFDLEQDDLAAALLSRLGESFGDDARGVFVVPDVALAEARSHKTFDAVVDAIGEVGMWVRRPSAVETMEDRALGMDDLLAQALAGKPVSPAMLATLLGSVSGDGSDDGEDDDDLTATQMDGEDDDPSATAMDMPIDIGSLLASPELRGVMERLAGTIASSPETQKELEGAAARGLDFEALSQSPAIAQLMQGFMEELGKNPAALSALLAGGVGPHEGDDDE